MLKKTIIVCNQIRYGLSLYFEIRIATFDCFYIKKYRLQSDNQPVIKFQFN